MHFCLNLLNFHYGISQVKFYFKRYVGLIELSMYYNVDVKVKIRRLLCNNKLVCVLKCAYMFCLFQEQSEKLYSERSRVFTRLNKNCSRTNG